jgi:hypothetical protein
MRQVPPEAVELPDDERIARLEGLETGQQPGVIVPLAAS